MWILRGIYFSRTKSGACEIIVKMLPNASVSGKWLLISILDAMESLCESNIERRKSAEDLFNPLKRLKASKGILLDILSRQYDDPLIHKKEVIVSLLLVYSSEDFYFFEPLVIKIKDYYAYLKHCVGTYVWPASARRVMVLCGSPWKIWLRLLPVLLPIFCTQGTLLSFEYFQYVFLNRNWK